jgi:hypothetical protein
VLITGGLPISAELYDPSSGTFSATGGLAVPRDSHTATLLEDGRVLVAGGWGGGYLSSAELYDPSTGTFTTTGPLAAARSSHTATLLQDGRVLLAGGRAGPADSLSSLEVYDPATGAFSGAGALVTARMNQTATLLPDGTVLFAGAGSNMSTANAELYDPARATVTQKPMVSPRGSATAALAGGKVLVAGGMYQGFLASAERYDPLAGTFSATGAMAEAHSFNTATLLLDGRVLVVGGVSDQGVDAAGIAYPVTSGAERFDPATGRFTVTGSMATPRLGQTATRLLDGRVLITGGRGPLGSLASAELYDPEG